ncbi:heparinase II/III family protein [Echinicola sp. 20G]|uniref:heparinase II/III domain-containing protein n=1 Tax=Echinicola sp. 20G TaxID=2781961 RepID=UPI0019108B6A|nr:heparinase II/III family protein [Echinicola sp. 20G]
MLDVILSIMRKPKLVLAFILLFISEFIFAQEKRDLLQHDLEKANMDTWHNDPVGIFPDKASLKKNFDKLPDGVLEQIQVDAQTAFKYEWPSIPASAYLDFVRNGNRTRMQNFQNQRTSVLKSLVMAELLEQEGKYLDPIADAIWALCEQSTWVLSAHLGPQKGGAGVPNIADPLIDLGSGEVANLLAWVYFYFRSDLENVSPLLVQRLENEIKERIITPYLARDDFWWMGFDSSFVNNWNPWCNYNVLLATFLVEEDQAIKQQVYEKSMRSVDQFINYYKSDGACEEGPAYWDHAGGKMLEYLALIHQISSNEIYIGDQSLIKNMGNYIRKTHIAGEYYVNFADASASLKAHPGIIYRYGKYVSDEKLKGFAVDIAQQVDFSDAPLNGSLDRMLHNLSLYTELLRQSPYTSPESYFLYPETEIIGGRSREGFFFAAKGGHNNESHNHNDVGSFILYFQGKPVLVDLGVETYSAKTFSSERYEIWTMQSDFHNLPKINGFSQKSGKKYSAQKVDFDIGRSFLRFDLDISKSYPTEAACKHWNRTYTLNRERAKFDITDQFELEQFHSKSELHFMCYDKPVEIGKGVVKIGENDGKDIILKYPYQDLCLKILNFEMKDARLQKAWNRAEVFQILFTQREEKRRDEWHISVMIR